MLHWLRRAINCACGKVLRIKARKCSQTIKTLPTMQQRAPKAPRHSSSLKSAPRSSRAVKRGQMRISSLKCPNNQSSRRDKTSQVRWILTTSQTWLSLKRRTNSLFARCRKCSPGEKNSTRSMSTSLFASIGWNSLIRRIHWSTTRSLLTVSSQMNKAWSTWTKQAKSSNRCR